MPLSFSEWLVFAVTGRVLIYLWSIFPLPTAPNHIKKYYVWQMVEKLHVCDLCAGVWIYALLALVTGSDMSGANSIITMAATGALTSFIVHLFMLGVREKFSSPVII